LHPAALLTDDSGKQPPDQPFNPVLAPVELPLLRGTNVLEAPVAQEALTERYTEEAIRFIRTNRDRPFFLYLPHTFPHRPLHASGKFRGQSRAGLYGDTVKCLDWSAGRILDTLADLGLDEQTLVCFTSDNGPPPGAPAQGERGGSGSAEPFRGWKFTAYEGGFRVPAIFRLPGSIPARRVCTELATTTDLLPTFAKLAGAKVPRDRTLHGEDIWPLLTQAKARSPHKLFCYYLDNQLQAVRSGQWKLLLEQHEYPSLILIRFQDEPNSGSVSAWQDHAGLIHSLLSGRN
jgi:arylsulfatase A